MNRSAKTVTLSISLASGLISGLANAQNVTGAEALLGFDASASALQRTLEADFDSRLDAQEMEAWLRDLSFEPHHVGSPKGLANAKQIAELFTSWGYETEIAEYEILFPTPKTRELELVSPGSFTASLTEDPLAADPSTSRTEDLLPPYNAFSRDGEVEAELVFVNYGMPADYEVLERHGISVEGKIAIAKYGRSWRGIKPKLAGEKGAIGTLIYSDPLDDGYGQGDTYPEGPFKHESAVQRGSVMDMPTYPGDVLTPGIGATPDAVRLDRADAPTITEIPVLPISHRDAMPLLAAMGGDVVPPEWRGGLPITYHMGPGPARVRLKLEFDWTMVTAYNVIARLEGAEHPDEWVIRGNHHDGWNHGAADPISGLVALMAEAKAIGELAQTGKRPARTLIYAAWDAEEPGLIGSTEWVEHHAAELSEHAVAYLNTDGNSRGFISVGGSHSLEKMMGGITSDVVDPQTGVSVDARRRAMLTLEGGSERIKTEAKTRAQLRISPLGSGSDYTPFLQHLGIASVNIAFGGEAQDGSYHTLYDTYEHYMKFRDPGLEYGVALAQVAGRATLRLANAQRLPFEFSGLADNIALYLSEIEALTATLRSNTETTNTLLEAGTYALALDPKKNVGPPSSDAPVPYFNFARLQNALTRLEAAASAYEGVIDKPASSEINQLLYTSERLLTREHGLSGRPWFKHHLYAPGFYTGYGVKTLPGVRETIEQRQFDAVEEQIEIAAEMIHDLAARVEALTE